ncbi:MAG: glycosyltransferase family protein [Pigmentiphaga sp.]
MRILYGVQGTGNGHISRARAMAPALAAAGHQVDYLFSGRPAAAYFDMAEFGRWQACDGVTFVVEGGRVRLWRSATQLRLGRWWREVRRLPMEQYDLVITDFEPVTAWAARRAGTPSINLSHQAAFAYPVPRMAGSRITRALLRHYAPSRHWVGLHWHHFGQPILPPLIQVSDEVRNAGSTASVASPEAKAGAWSGVARDATKGTAPGATAGVLADAVSRTTTRPGKPFILVYLPFERRADIRRVLAPLREVDFVCYHPDVAVDEEVDGVPWRRLSREGFQRDLHRAEGVICNAGFELPSEALALGRKLLVKPLSGQFEQLSNALALERLGLATRTLALDPRAVEHWLTLPPAEPVSYPAVAAALADWIGRGRWGEVDDLARGLWSKVRFPSYFREPV